MLTALPDGPARLAALLDLIDRARSRLQLCYYIFAADTCGYQVRDALHVADAVAAWVSVLDRFDAVRGRVFNLGGGPSNAISLRELLERIAVLHGNPPSVLFAAWRPGDQPWYVSNIEAIRSALRWEPQVPLAQGLPSLLGWIQERFGAHAAKAAEGRR